MRWSVRWCTLYASSQKIRKSAAAVVIAASRSACRSETQVPVGLLYFGTNHMPLMRASDAARRSISSMSSPPSAAGSTGIISMPNFSQIEKCRS